MKPTKKLTAMLLSLMMALMLVIPAFAAGGNYSITIENEAQGHTYEAYQIFSGDLSSDSVLSNIQWGESVNGAALLAALQTADAEKYGSCDSAAKVAEALGGGDGTEATAADAEAFAKVAEDYLTTPKGSADTPTGGNYVISGLPAGYYLVKDKDNSLEGSHDAYTNYIVQVVENVTMAPKSGTTTSEKKVKDINDSQGLTYTDWQDSADYDIGDRIPFQLKATLPANYSTYSQYALTFHDTESAGLSFQSGSVKVYIDGKLVDGGNYTVVTEGLGGGFTFEVRFEDLKKITAADGVQAGNNSVVTVEYESVLNEGAVIGGAGNPNTMHITYSNNPNGEGKGKTPDDTVIVFTYKVIVDKVNQEREELPGAEFTLEKKIVNGQGESWETVEVLGTDGSLTTFTFAGLDDGDYRLSETKTPGGYNTIEPIEFTVTAQHDMTLTSLSGNTVTGEIVMTANLTEGSLSATVVNNKGAQLPETGGMGTTLFYVLGGVLVVGAGVLLVVKRRVGTENKEE